MGNILAYKSLAPPEKISHKTPENPYFSILHLRNLILFMTLKNGKLNSLLFQVFEVNSVSPHKLLVKTDTETDMSQLAEKHQLPVHGLMPSQTVRSIVTLATALHRTHVWLCTTQTTMVDSSSNLYFKEI